MILKFKTRLHSIIMIYTLSLIANHVHASTKAEEEKFQLAKSYLCRYGYLPKNVCFFKVFRANDFLSKHSDKMRIGLILFQKMFNLTETGKINTNSIVKMGTPRCGNEDFIVKPLKPTPYIDTRKIFKEGENQITYALRNFNFYNKDVSKTVSNAFIDTNIQNAFQAWFKYLNASLTVKKIKASYEYFKNTPRGDVTFMFAEGRHGDAMPFDAENGELSHAATLSSDNKFRGYVHLDDEEDWSTENKLFTILVHEIGHLFGLNHSSNSDSIMAPIIKTKRNQLFETEDILNLQRALGLSLAEINENESNITDFVNEKTNTTRFALETTTITTTTTTVKAPVQVVDKKLSYLENLIKELKALSGKGPVPTLTTTTTASIDTTTTPTETTTTSTETTTTSTETTVTSTETTTIRTTIATTLTNVEKSTSIILQREEDRPIESIIDEILEKKNNNNHLRLNKQQSTSIASEKKISFSSPDAEYEHLLRILGIPAKLVMATDALNTTDFTSFNSTSISSYNSTEISNTDISLAKAVTDITINTITTTKSISPRLMQPNDTDFFNNIYSQQQKHESKKLFFEQFCKQPDVDAMTRTEWGNVFVFKGDMMWHIRGLTKWSIVDYEGWPKKSSSMFPDLPNNIDSAFFLENHYYFTKDKLIWKYSLSKSSSTRYIAITGYPKVLQSEFPNIPYKSVDSAFSSGSSVFFFKDFSFWQSSWNDSITYPMPFKTISALSWKQPGSVFNYSEPLAYLISGVTMHQFNYWNINLQTNNVDIRYFLFDCLETNPKPDGQVFIGPNYSHTYINDDMVDF